MPANKDYIIDACIAGTKRPATRESRLLKPTGWGAEGNSVNWHDKNY